MVAGATAFGRVVAAYSPFLRSITCHDRRVQIQCHAVDRDLPEQPAVEIVHHGIVETLGEFAEQPHDRLEVGHASKPEQTFQHRVVAGDFAMFETIGATPDREHELEDELLGTVASVATRLR